MSQHAQLTPEAEQQLRAQKRNSTISAIIISLLCCTLLVAILYYIALATLSKNTEELVTYSSGTESEEKLIKPEMTDQVEKKPSSPSASMSKVIASSTPSPTAVPVPDVTVTEPTLDFGDGNDFGDGWGSGTGAGSGGGGVSFFKQSVKAERIAYVIDYSASMRGKKFELMKKELAKSVRDLPDTVDYQLIFFAGPAWVASDQVHGGGKGQAVSFTRDGKKYDWKNSKGASNLPPAEWIRSDKEQRKKSLKIIKDTGMIFGTKWDIPIEYALNMSPQPDIIFFMTDGTAGKNTADIAKQIGRDAKKKGVIINCIALMEPKAKDAMADIAKRTGGIFTEVQENGRTKQHDLK